MRDSLFSAKASGRQFAAALAIATLAVTGAQAASTAPNATAVEYFNTTLKHYFITAAPDEIASIDAGGAGGGWERTGRDFAVWTNDAGGNAPDSASDVYRFYSYASNSHFYSADHAEVAFLRTLNPTNADRQNWILEGKVFRVEMPAAGACAPGLKPVYRSYNDRSAAHDTNHRLIGGAEVMSAMESRGWIAEGVAMCSNAVDVDPARRASSTAESASLMPTSMAGPVGAVLNGGEFTLLGVTVDGSNARFEQGAAQALRAGAEIEVEGYPAKGKLIATVIGVKSADSSIDPSTGKWEGYISAVTPAGAIYVNGQLVNVANAVIVGGSAASLVPGARVEVRGLIQAGVLNAVRIEVKSGGDGIRHDEIATNELRGTVGDYASLAQFTINGQRVDGSRAYIENGSQTTLANGVMVEAHGVMQGAVFVASRIEIKSSHGAGSGHDTSSAGALKYEGIVANLSGGNRFNLNGQPVDASSAWFEHGSALELRDGVQVEATGVLAAGLLVAYKVEFKSASSSRDDGTEARIDIRGSISAFTGANRFVVNGQTVDATNAVIWGPAGATLAVGAIVEVEGTLRDGVLMAGKIEIKSGNDSHSDDGGTKAKGVISSFTSIADFVVAGQRVDATQAQFEHGNAGMPAAGVYVEAKGNLVTGRLVATKIEFAH